ncbi:hypothetical protein EDD22DRAFT_908089 [Suillus occidentalis]|nr:hypothetical protein EDD22DRAFT_908089 [Suillus occidentalis]
MTSGHPDTFCTRLDTVNDLPAEKSSCLRLFFSRYTPIFLLGALQGEGGLGIFIDSPRQLLCCQDLCIPYYAPIFLLGALQGEGGEGTIIYSPHQLLCCPDVCIPHYALIFILRALQGELGLGTIIYSPHQLLCCPDVCIPHYALIFILRALQGELGLVISLPRYLYPTLCLNLHPRRSTGRVRLRCVHIFFYFVFSSNPVAATLRDSYLLL